MLKESHFDVCIYDNYVEVKLCGIKWNEKIKRLQSWDNASYCG